MHTAHPFQPFGNDLFFNCIGNVVNDLGHRWVEGWKGGKVEGLRGGKIKTYSITQ
jgi:hypothetical protein